MAHFAIQSGHQNKGPKEESVCQNEGQVKGLGGKNQIKSMGGLMVESNVFLSKKVDFQIFSK